MADLTNSQGAMASALTANSRVKVGTIFDANQPMSFAGRRFPFERYEVHGAARKHVHEYPHTPGGAPEKLGRSLYEISVEALFDANLLPTVYRDLWPKGLAFIRSMYETQQTDTLVIPTIGEMPCFIDDYRSVSTNMHLSGERVSLKFLEDSSAAFIASQIAIPSSGAIVEAGEYFKQEALPIGVPILQAIAELYADVVAYRDTFGMLTATFDAKLTGLLKMLAFADSTCKELQDPANLLGYDALHALWASAVKVANDTAAVSQDLRTFVIPSNMYLSDVSIRLFGDTAHSSDLIALNSIVDPFALIKASTRIRYYPSARIAA
jgi:hypothetical protein